MPEPERPFDEPTFDEPAFDEPWQAQSFAMTVALHRAGRFSWPEWSATLAEALLDEPRYWHAWTAALERMVARHGISGESVERRTSEWRHAADRTPHGQPIVLHTPGS